MPVPVRSVLSYAARMWTSLRVALLTSSLLATACDPAPAAVDGGRDAPAVDAWREPGPEVVTSLGTVVGERGDGFSAYLGIPYARPPVGELRWASPEPHPGWDEPLRATRAPNACPQNALGFDIGEEDCLYLNVHVPDPAPEGAPVMVWIHGGAFVFGEGLQVDHGTAGDLLAAEHGVVVVSMNYRLGILGFLRHPSLAGSSGNQGIEDQQLALQWVHDHIADFGGDPDNVTIVGESAGGFSVCAHMISPASEGLFHRVISESGLCDMPLTTGSDVEVLAGDALEMLGCTTGDVAACARAAPVGDVTAAAGPSGDVITLVTSGSRPFWPTIDGTVIPTSFRDAVLAGDVADVPTIVGWNADEGTLFVAFAEREGVVADAASYDLAVTRLATETGLTEAAIEAAYPLASYPDAGAAIADMTGDQRLACASRRAALLLSGAGHTTYVYRFDFEGAGFQLSLDRDMGAFHSAEIQYVFGHPVGTGGFDGGEETLNDLMSDAWARFARTGDPNGTLPTWATYEEATQTSMTLTPFPSAATMVDADDCALWDSALATP